jgi:hypothetical protein
LNDHMEIHSLITDAPLSREDAEVLTGVPRLALLELHHGVGGLKGDALADTVGAIRKFEGAPVGSEVVAAGECVAATAGDLELDRPYQRGVSEVVHMLEEVLTVAAESLARRVVPSTPIGWAPCAGR